jgi:cation diffusion facilitator CzcD-associated flavoprotein CzcO
MIDNKLGSDADTLVVGAGQAGLAAGMALRHAGLSFMIVDAADQPGGSWARYYDSLTLFSPSRFSSLPGLRLPDGAAATRPGTRWPTTSAPDNATNLQLTVAQVRVCATPAGTNKRSRSVLHSKAR